MGTPVHPLVTESPDPHSPRSHPRPPTLTTESPGPHLPRTCRHAPHGPTHHLEGVVSYPTPLESRRKGLRRLSLETSHSGTPRQQETLLTPTPGAVVPGTRGVTLGPDGGVLLSGRGGTPVATDPTGTTAPEGTRGRLLSAHPLPPPTQVRVSDTSHPRHGPGYEEEMSSRDRNPGPWS